MATTNGSRSVSLIRKASIIGFGVRTLVRDIDLAKREISEKVKQAGVGAGMLAAAGILCAPWERSPRQRSWPWPSSFPPGAPH